MLRVHIDMSLWKLRVLDDNNELIAETSKGVSDMIGAVSKDNIEGVMISVARKITGRDDIVGDHILFIN